MLVHCQLFDGVVNQCQNLVQELQYMKENERLKEKVGLNKKSFMFSLRLENPNMIKLMIYTDK